MLLRRLPLVGRAWLNDHIENFIKPNIPGGEIPDINTYGDPKANRSTNPWVPIPYDYGGTFLWKMRTQPEILQAFLELWEEAKKRAKGKTILLPGRDTWMFEVLARLEGTKTIFRPDISSATMPWVSKYDPQREEFKACYGLDSGNVGSIPRGLKCVDFGLVYKSDFNLQWQLLKHQAAGKYYEIYCILEAMPHYWVRAVMSDSVAGIGPKESTASAHIVQQVGGNAGEGVWSFQIASVGTILLANYWLKMNPDHELKNSVLLRRAKLRAALKTIEARRGLSSSLAARRRRIV